MQVLFQNTPVTAEELTELHGKFPWEAFPERAGWICVKADQALSEGATLYALIPDTGTEIDTSSPLSSPTVDLLVVGPGFIATHYAAVMRAEALFIWLAKAVADQVPEREAYTWVLTEVDLDHVTYTGMCGKEVGPVIRIDHNLLNPLVSASSIVA